eukprot:GHVO01057862.1.p1 GENE.GHVO01057862.1~~GHVO01057862.1.p1  ORF type:complete len:359 (-),score=31.03 GHVO01057862.1:28-1104(-)
MAYDGVGGLVDIMRPNGFVMSIVPYLDRWSFVMTSRSHSRLRDSLTPSEAFLCFDSVCRILADPGTRKLPPPHKALNMRSLDLPFGTRREMRSILGKSLRTLESLRIYTTVDSNLRLQHMPHEYDGNADPIELPRLKVLHLYDSNLIEIDNEAPLDLNCRNLTDMRLDSVNLERTSRLNLVKKHAGNLKALSLRHVLGHPDFDIHLDLPALEKLEVEDNDVIPVFDSNKITDLVWCDDSIPDFRKAVQNGTKNVEVLHITRAILENCSPSEFPSVKQLVVSDIPPGRAKPLEWKCDMQILNLDQPMRMAATAFMIGYNVLQTTGMTDAGMGVEFMLFAERYARYNGYFRVDIGEVTDL